MKPIILKTLNILVPTTMGISTVVPTTLIAVDEYLHPKGQYYQEAKELKKVAIDEFIELCKYPHPTFGTRQICDHLKDELKNIGYKETTDVSVISDGYYFLEDNYRAHDPDFPEGSSSGNLIFEIPATVGCKDMPGIVLQAHMDMVVDGVSHKDSINTKICPVIDGNKIYAKDHLTSLGADDGAGLAVILALAKNPDIVEHGPLRCIITADEEDGESGASKITYEDLKYDYVLNLDGEEKNIIITSAAGTRDIVFQVNDIKSGFFEDVDKTRTHEYKITVQGLLGGHSAQEINKGRASAINLVSRIAIYIKDWTTSMGGVFNIVSMEGDNLNNTISQKATIDLISTLPYEDERQICISQLLEVKLDEFQKQYQVETGLEIVCDEIVDSAQRSNIALNFDGTKNIVELIPTLPFGPLSWLDEDRKEVESSCNVSSLKLDFTHPGSDDNPQFQVECLARSSYEPSLSMINGYLFNQASEYIADMVTERSIMQPIHVASTTPSWEPIPDNEYWNLVISAMKDAQIKNVQRQNNHGWLEIGFFWKAYQEMGVTPHIVSLGPTITECHSINETLYLDSYQPFIQSVLYIINRIDQLKN